MIKLFKRKEECCACTACKSICPVDAIKMIADEEGFLYPQINSLLCTECGFCKKVCAFQNGYDIANNFSEPIVYAMKHKSDEVRMNSSSGGAFTAISDYILKDKKGVVYGAAYSENFSVIHQRTETADNRDRFRGSKYVQSDLMDTFKDINTDLNKGKYVLFSGTGCQVAGLNSYLAEQGADVSRLLTVDLICHGTPSPLLWQDYLSYIQKKSRLNYYTFRSKECGWRGYNVLAKFEDGKQIINTPKIKLFANLFGSNLALRPACYECKYANTKRPGDITIGDFWGIEKSLPELDDNKGISLLYINNDKCTELLKYTRINADIVISNVNESLQYNLIQPTVCPINRKNFWQDYYRHGFSCIAKIYGGISLKTYIKRVAAWLLRRLNLYDNVKKIFGKS